MKIKRSYLDIHELIGVSAAYKAKNSTGDNKIMEAIRKLMKQVSQKMEEYHDAVDDLQINNCMTHVDGPKKGAIIYEETTGQDGKPVRSRCFSPEGEKNLKRDIKLLLQKEVLLDSRVPEGISDLIKDLTEQEIKCFSGLVIPGTKKELVN